MRYTITEGPNTGKRINIPDADLQRIEKSLDLDLNGAIAVYLSDEGLLVDPIVTELTAVAKDAGAGAKAQGDVAKRKPPVRKPDEVKRSIVAALAEFIEGTEGVTDTDVTNIERMIAFSLGGDKYEVTLTKKRAPKN